MRKFIRRMARKQWRRPIEPMARGTLFARCINLWLRG